VVRLADGAQDIIFDRKNATRPQDGLGILLTFAIRSKRGPAGGLARSGGSTSPIAGVRDRVRKSQPLNRNDCTGFTLLEVLIATALLSVVIFLTTLSYSMILDVWAQKKIVGQNTLTNYRSHLLVRFALESVYDYYVTDPMNETKGLYYPLFRGERDMLEFVTLSAVFSKGVPAVARVRLAKQAGNAPEHYQLLYEEAPLDSTYVRYRDALPPYRRSLVIYPKVEQFSMRYFGEWEARWVREREDFEMVSKWQDTFSGEEKQTIPEIIELTVRTAEEETTLVYQVRANNIHKRSFFQPFR
jgi:prepilin-type N-terminal cleavage/methylation domain-containing protein